MTARTIYGDDVLLDPAAATELAERRDRFGAQIRVTAEEINETIVLDRRVVILPATGVPALAAAA